MFALRLLSVRTGSDHVGFSGQATLLGESEPGFHHQHDRPPGRGGIHRRTEPGRADYPDRQTKVRAIEEVKELGAKQEVLRLSKPEGPANRQIKIDEVVAASCIPAHGAIASEGEEIGELFSWREGDPLRSVSGEKDQAVRRSRPVSKIAIEIGIDGKIEREGLPGMRLKDRSDLPVLQQSPGAASRIAVEGQVPQQGSGKAVANVEIGVAAFRSKVERVLSNHRRARNREKIRDIIDGVRPGVSGRELKVMVVAFAGLDLQRVVNGVG